MKPEVSFIVLNWNGWKDTIECLESLYQINYPNFNIIMVDNGSKDESVLKIKEYCEGKNSIESKFFDYSPKNKPIKIFEYNEDNLNMFKNDKSSFKNISSYKKIIIIKNFENKGYTDGNNIGMNFVLKHLDSEYIMILNNDIVVDSNFLNELIIVTQKNQNIGILGPADFSYYEPDKIQVMGAKVNFWTGGWHALNQTKFLLNQKTDAITVDFVGGAAFMIKREVIEKIGVFYSPYFANWEETDYCIKAQKNGFKVLCVPKSKIWHKVSSSISLNNPNRIYWILRNNIIFMRRNAKIMHLPSFFIFYFVLRVPSFIYWGFHKNSINSSLKLIYLVMKAIKEGITLNINKNS